MTTDILGRSSLGLEREVTELLLKIGVPAHIKGFRILRRAILITIDDSQAIESITNILYLSLIHISSVTERTKTFSARLLQRQARSI